MRRSPPSASESSRRGAVALLALALVSVAPRTVMADATEASEVEARAAMKRGVAAFARHDATTALAEYRRAQALAPDANQPYRYAAEALVELERYEEAIVEFEKYLAVKPDVSDAEEVRARIQAARAKSRGTLSVTSVPPGAEVFVDGAAIRSGVTPIANLVLPRGEHTVVVRFPGHRDVVHTPFVVGGATVALSSTLAEVERPAPPAPPEAKPSSGQSTLGWTVLGSGAALLAGSFAVDALVLRPAFDDFDARRKAGAEDALDAKTKVTTLQTALVVGYATGAVATGLGAALLLWPRRSGAHSTIVPVASVGYQGIAFTGTFGVR